MAPVTEDTEGLGAARPALPAPLPLPRRGSSEGAARGRTVAVRFGTSASASMWSIGQRLLHTGHRLSFLVLIVVGGLDLLQLDGDRDDLAGEPERRLVGLGHRCPFIRADVSPFVGRVEAALRALDAPGRDLLAVDEERALAAPAHTAPVITELEPDRCLAGRQRLWRGDGVPPQAEPVVGIGRPAVLQIETPAAEPACLSEQRAIRDAVLGNLDLGGDRVRLIL